MATKLQKEIRREIEIDGEPFTVAISPTGVKLTKKRFRSGRALSWRALWQNGADEQNDSNTSASSGNSDG
jgi:hypothetical protein